MQKNILRSEPFGRRARLSSREIVLAVAVTCAALAFVLAAVVGSQPETAAVIEPAPAKTRAN